MSARQQLQDSESRSGPILVRVAPEILAHLASGDVEPVVTLGVEEHEDGTHDMILSSVGDVVPRSEAEALAEALEAVNLVNPPAALREYRARHPKETP